MDAQESLVMAERPDSPITVRFYTPEEERTKSFTARGTAYLLKGEIALRRGLPSQVLGQTFTHEQGHFKYPIHWRKAATAEEGVVQELFSELLANYHEVSYHPVNAWVRGKIRSWKNWAWRQGVSSSQISRIDKLARGEVGYTRGEIVTPRERYSGSPY